MKYPLPVPLAACLLIAGCLASSAVVAATDFPSAFARCRGLGDTAARLACYDALPLDAAAAPAAGAAVPDGFGRMQPATPEPEAIDSSIPGRFEGWGPGQVLRLANGQAWQVVDGSRAAYWLDSPKVRVRRGVLGAFYLEIVGKNQTARVQRID